MLGAQASAGCSGNCCEGKTWQGEYVGLNSCKGFLQQGQSCTHSSSSAPRWRSCRVIRFSHHHTPTAHEHAGQHTRCPAWSNIKVLTPQDMFEVAAVGQRMAPHAPFCASNSTLNHSNCILARASCTSAAAHSQAAGPSTCQHKRHLKGSRIAARITNGADNSHTTTTYITTACSTLSQMLSII